MLIVKCPKCNGRMKCAPRKEVTKAVKQCVYCGRNFKVHANIEKSRIIKEI